MGVCISWRNLCKEVVISLPGPLTQMFRQNIEQSYKQKVVKYTFFCPLCPFISYGVLFYCDLLIPKTLVFRCIVLVAKILKRCSSSDENPFESK